MIASGDDMFFQGFPDPCPILDPRKIKQEYKMQSKITQPHCCSSDYLRVVSLFLYIIILRLCLCDDTLQ